MKTPYFCAYHAEKLRASETEAIQSWSNVMRRGVNAYSQCRLDAAEIYLESALDIALIRSECELNGVFGAVHLIKPLEFLTELHLTNDNFERAISIINKVTSNNPESLVFFSKDLDELLAALFKRIEDRENEFFHKQSKKTHSPQNTINVWPELNQVLH